MEKDVPIIQLDLNKIFRRFTVFSTNALDQNFRYRESQGSVTWLEAMAWITSGAILKTEKF
jgi:hypothetical protein